MNTRVQELIETLDALLYDLHTAGCQFAMVLIAPDDKASFHSWRCGNIAMLYGALQAIEQQVYDDLVDAVREWGEQDDTE